MLKIATLLLFIFVASAQAQQPLPPTTFPTPTIRFHTSTQTVVEESIPFCPLSIAAQPHDSPQSTLVNSVEGAKLTPGAAGRTGVRVRINSLEDRTMTHLTLEVLFRAYPHGIVPVGSRPPIQERETFELDAADVASLSRNLLVAGNVDIQRIKVQSVLFSDGTSCKAPTSLNTCSVKPSHVVLVGSR